MTCARCGTPITKDQPRVTHIIDAASGPGTTLVLHERCRPGPRTRPTPYPTERD